ncbi:MAG: hypothetical protein IPH28_19770 [Cytophagaceae bacterium]|nr:hypothetical protein [Cytophagaceae bacterium]
MEILRFTKSTLSLKQAIIASNSERGYKQFSGYFENKTLSNKNIDLNYSNAHIWVMEANSDFEKGDVITAKWKLDSAIKYFSNPSTRHAKLLVTGLFFRIPVNIKLNRFSDVKQDLAVAWKIVSS